jgi:hypothetical protein
MRRLRARVIAIEDNPRPREDVPACVAQDISDLSRCATPEKEARADAGVAARMANRLATVDVIDPRGSCAATELAQP